MTDAPPRQPADLAIVNCTALLGVAACKLRLLGGAQ